LCRHRRHRQAHCRRSAVRRVPVERTFRLRDFTRPARHHLWRRSAGLSRRLEYLAIVEEERLLENVAKVGGYLHQQLQGLVDKYAATREVRGRGFIQGLVLDIPARPLVEQGLAEGVLFNVTQDTVLRFLPPFLLEEKHVDKGIRVLKKLLGKKRKKARSALSEVATAS